MSSQHIQTIIFLFNCLCNYLSSILVYISSKKIDPPGKIARIHLTSLSVANAQNWIENVKCAFL